jgi:hypothetical protein
MFFAPLDGLSYTGADDTEKLFIFVLGKFLSIFPASVFVLGTQNLANVAHGEKLSSVFDGWEKEDLALLGAQLLLNAYDKFTETFGSHPKISYCRLNGKFSAF